MVAEVALLTSMVGALGSPATRPPCMTFCVVVLVCVPPSLITLTNVKQFILLATFSDCSRAATSEASIMPSAVILLMPSFSILVLLGAA